MVGYGGGGVQFISALPSFMGRVHFEGFDVNGRLGYFLRPDVEIYEPSLQMEISIINDYQLGHFENVFSNFYLHYIPKSCDP